MNLLIVAEYLHQAKLLVGVRDHMLLLQLFAASVCLSFAAASAEPVLSTTDGNMINLDISAPLEE